MAERADGKAEQQTKIRMEIEDSRPSEYKRVLEWLNTGTTSEQVDVYGISGYGGIGKSFLMDQVISQFKPESQGFLQIKVDGSKTSILGDFMGVYDQRLCPGTLPGGKAKYDYFPHARRLASAHERLIRSMNKTVSRAGVSDDVKKAAKTILRSGAVLNKTVPKSKEYIDFEQLQKLGVGEAIEDAVDLASDTVARARSIPLPGRVKDVLGISFSERLRRDLYGLAAEEWVSDLCAILNRYRGVDRFRLTHSPIEGLDRLLLIIDDFEILGKTIHVFLTDALIAELQRANFHTTIIVLGRDDLADASAAFQHHRAHLVRDRVRLEALDNGVTERMFREAGYSDEEVPQLMEESRGYPFLVRLLCEARGGSVSFYQQFYQRTTRWMGLVEKDWVLQLC